MRVKVLSAAHRKPRKSYLRWRRIFFFQKNSWMHRARFKKKFSLHHACAQKRGRRDTCKRREGERERIFFSPFFKGVSRALARGGPRAKLVFPLSTLRKISSAGAGVFSYSAELEIILHLPAWILKVTGDCSSASLFFSFLLNGHELRGKLLFLGITSLSVSEWFGILKNSFSSSSGFFFNLRYFHYFTSII